MGKKVTKKYMKKLSPLSLFNSSELLLVILSVTKNPDSLHEMFHFVQHDIELILTIEKSYILKQ